MELRLYHYYAWQRPTNLGCGRGAQRRWTLYCGCRSRVARLSRTRIRNSNRPTAGNWMKNWELIADNLSKSGWSWGCVSAIDSNERTIWITDAHRGNGKGHAVHAGEKLTAFVGFRAAIHRSSVIS